MYARAPVKPRPQTSQIKDWKAPVAGWVANRNLAQPNQPGMPQGAAVLDNWFPTATSIIMRRGKELYATLGQGALDASALFSYVLGNNQKLFGATSTTIYDITTVSSPTNYALVTEDGDSLAADTGDTIGDNSTAGHFEVYEGLTSGKWIVVQFTVTGGTYLIGVNGVDTGFIYDGAAFYPSVPGGVWTIAYGSGTVDFTKGQTVTGGTSAATATILDIVPSGTAGVGALLLTDITGTFSASETLTDGAGGSATSTSLATSVVPGISFPAGLVLTTADLCYGWAYKSRLWFIQKETLDVWYLPVDSVGGELVRLQMGADFQRGGALLFGASWSLDSGNQGGLSEQCIFVTDEGEVSVWQGNNPADTANWSRVGVYRIGRPLGNKAFIRAGGDLVIATSVGFVPLSQAIQRDYAALSPSAVSYPIEEAWNDATQTRGLLNWNCLVWSEAQMVCVSPPTTEDTTPVLFVANARTGAWARYTNWEVLCGEVFQGQFYFGSPEGKVFAANVSGFDDGQTYTCAYLPLFEDLGSPVSLKVGEMGWAAIRAANEVDVRVDLNTDFDVVVPSAPDASPVNSSSEWGTAVWGESVWGATTESIVSQRWQSIGGMGYAMSLCVQVTSGSIAPVDGELIRSGITFSTAGIIS